MLWISSVHVVGAGVYVYMQFFPVTLFLVIAAHFIWVFIHGSPPLIYLSMNATIKRDIRDAVLRTAKQVVVELAPRSATVTNKPQTLSQLAPVDPPNPNDTIGGEK